jgi:phosphohistidine phosphatase
MTQKVFEGDYNQSGIIPFRKKDGKNELLMITSRGGKKWIFPKGIVEPDMTSVESAAKEAYEEAGVKGEIYPKKIGTYTYKKWGDQCRVQVYLMRVNELLKEWPEAYLRQRKWVFLEEAKELVQLKELRKILNHVPDIIDRYDKK